MKRFQAVVGALVALTLAALIAGCGAGKPVVKSVVPKEVFPGTGIIITGTGFAKTQGKSTVRLGSKTVTVSSWSDKSITAKVPQDMTAGAADVTVTTGSGTSNKVSITVESVYTGSTPLPAMQNYLKSKGVNTTGMTFSVVATSTTDPDWKLDKAADASQNNSYFLFRKDPRGWTIVDYGKELSADRLKADGAPDDIPPTQPAASSSGAKSSSSKSE